MPTSNQTEKVNFLANGESLPYSQVAWAKRKRKNESDCVIVW